MKFPQWLSFFNHVREASSKGHLASAYAILGGSESDRHFVARRILSICYPGESAHRFQMGEDAFEAVKTCLYEKSLFEKHTLIVLEGIEKLKKEELESLYQMIMHPAPDVFFIIGTGNSKTANELYQKGKKELIALDLLLEKSWEKLARLKTWVEILAKSLHKPISVEALQYLFDNGEHEIETLSQVLEKVALFIPNKTLIDKEDLAKVLPIKEQVFNFPVAEALIFGKLKERIELPSDASSLIGMIGMLRYQLHQGEKMASLLHTNASFDKIGSAFPQLKSSQLEKRLQSVKAFKSGYFLQAMVLLFELEKRIKNSQGNPSALFKDFVLKIEKLKREYA